MTSSTLAGERRWGSGRRSGMTVLGKVNVPKPINLPSQRLENHGLDPSVEIVPKGTHSWGSRSSSSSNAWGSSTLSPRADGGTGSPSHHSGRPSSGGTGTRPSTTGSDSAHEPITSAWGSNSRPSSASGALASNQTSHASLRPRSADTRPGSSQLSRFAESLTGNSVAWGASGTAEKLGVASTNDSFSLASGDFPTLGCEKDVSAMDMDSQEHVSHSRPGSSSNRIARKESTGNSVGDASINANVKSGAANSWRRENVPYSEDGARPGIEKWHPDPHAYPNSGMPPQHYDAWHGPPVNNHPGGGWYRGPPGGPPFGSPVPPGGFPIEPFPYYRPQIPPAALANQRPVPPPGAGPRGPHPKNGDMYRPHMHETYIRPGMPVRPGFYPGPVPYEGYYGPPMGYCNSNERDMPFMGMTVHPAPYNRYPGQNAPEASNSHGRSGGYGPNGKRMVLDQGESGHPPDSRGPYKVLLKQHGGWEGKEELKWGDCMESDASNPGKGDYPKSSSESDWRDENKKDEQIDSRRMGFGEEGYSEAVDNRRVIPVKVNSSENVKNQKASDDSSFKKLEDAEHAASAHPEASTTSKDPSLIQKIESLNAKARASGGRQDVKSASTKEEHKNKLHAGNPKFNQSAIAAGTASSERAHAPGVMDTQKSHISAVDKGLESTVSCGTSAPRRSTHAMNDRADHGKGRFSTQDADGQWKKPHVAHLPSGEPSLQFGSASVVSLSGVQENPGSYPLGKDDRESMPPNVDSVDSHVQRAKMSELAKQRLKQREKEEEERAREQKARALAKLEELNRRAQAGESSSQKPETAPSSASHNKQELLPLAQPVGVSDKGRITTSALGSKPNAIAEPETTVIRIEKPPSSSSGVLQAAPKAAHKEPVVYDQSESLQQEVGKVDSPHPNNAPPTHEAGISRQKRVGSKQKQNSLSEKNASEKLISSHATDTVKIDATLDVPASTIVSPKNVSNEITSSSGSNFLLSQTVMTDSSLLHRKKSRGGRNKHKVEESSATALSLMGSKDPTTLDAVVESSKPKTPESASASDPVSDKSVIDSKDSNQSQRTYLPSEEAHIRTNNQWKSQHSRRMPRNPQGSKSTEKFHAGDAVKWAPVRSQNKTEVIDEANVRTGVEVAIPATRSDQQVQNNARHKRAEIELYVPKPVAKEMAQQGSSHQSVAPSVQMSDDSVGRPDSGSLVAESSQTFDTGMGKVGSATEPRNGDGRQSKSGKVHGSWCQQGSLESTLTSNPGRNVQKNIEPRLAEKPEASTVKDQSSGAHDWGISDGWNIPEKPDEPASALVVKDHGVSGRGKRHPYKGHRSGHTYDPAEKRSNALDSDQSSSLEMSQAELHVSSKENRAVGERSITHWQPKPHQLPASNQRGSRTSGGHNAGAENCRPNKKDSTDKDITWSRDQRLQDQLLPVKVNFEEVPSEDHREGKKERKAISHKGGSNSPAEPSSNTNNRHEQRPSSGFCRNGNQNNRFGREHEYHGDWSGSGKDNKQQNAPANRERQRNSTHYEYQQVGAVPRNNNKASNFEPSKEGSHNSGVRYKDRGQGQGQSRRGGGNLYSQQSNDVRVDANYD